MQFASLALAGAAWFLLHAGVAGSPLRFWLIERVGEKRYRAGFSLASLASLVWLVHEYGRAPYAPLWLTPRALSFVPIVVVPLALVLLVGAFTVPSPTAVGGDKVLAADEGPRGLLRVTRHPFLWSVVLWALAHLAVNADPGSLLFFGSLGLTALRGTVDIDRKRRRTSPEQFARFEAQTSNVPLVALLQGRNRLVARELWLPLVLGLALALGAVALHPRLFGAPAVPLQLVVRPGISDERLMASDQPQVKGVAFRSVYASLGKLRGEGAQRTALQAVSQELRDGFAYRSIVPGGWYGIELYKELLSGIRRSTGEGKELVHEIGRQCTRDDMSGIYSVLAKLISPQSLFSLSQRVFSSYYSTGNVKMVESRAGFSQAVWSNCRGFDENMWTEVLGSCVQLLEIGGAKHVRIRVVTGGHDGSDAMEATAHWS